MSDHIRFQFHKGTIKTLIYALTLVGGYLFQFHKGTIKTRTVAVSRTANATFQFHKGTIKTSLLTHNALSVAYFNSIKVRLKHIKNVSQLVSKPISIP